MVTNRVNRNNMLPILRTCRERVRKRFTIPQIDDGFKISPTAHPKPNMAILFLCLIKRRRVLLMVVAIFIFFSPPNRRLLQADVGAPVHFRFFSMVSHLLRYGSKAFSEIAACRESHLFGRTPLCLCK